MSLGYRNITDCDISPDTFKRVADLCIKNSWKREWARADIPNRIRVEIQPFFTESRAIRREEIVLSRLRTDATMLTHMIPYIERRYPEICEECNELLTVQHILVDCVLYDRERRTLTEYFQSIGKRLSAFALLQDDLEIVNRLLTFLKASDLFNLL